MVFATSNLLLQTFVYCIGAASVFTNTNNTFYAFKKMWCTKFYIRKVVLFFHWIFIVKFGVGVLQKSPIFNSRLSRPGMGKKGKVKSNPHSKIDPIMPGHWKFAYWSSFKCRIWTRWEKNFPVTSWVSTGL
jgi:hypothetical protein